MSTRHELPDGAWVEIRDPRQVTYRQRRPLVMPYERLAKAFRNAAIPASMPASPKPGDARAAAPRIDVDESMLEDSEALTANLALALIQEWSYGPPPTTADALLDLPATALDALDGILVDYLPRLFLDVSPTMDDATPTEP